MNGAIPRSTFALLIALLLFATACTSTPTPPVTVLAFEGPTATAIPPTAAPTDTPAPTDTLPPPTDTPTPTATPTATETPTATPTVTNTAPPTLAATRTPKPATATPVLTGLQRGLRQTASSRSFRFQMNMFYSDPYQEIEMLSAEGEMSGSAAHMFMSTLPGFFPSGNAPKLEMITVGTKTYVKGPVPYSKADQPKWYVYPPKTGSSAAVKPSGFLTPEMTRYDKIGVEEVDGKSCEVYTIDKEAARQALIASGAITAKQMEQVVNIEATYWLCGDGYIHRSRVRIDSKYVLNPSTTTIMRLEIRFLDFNAPVEIVEPVGAEPMTQ